MRLAEIRAERHGGDVRLAATVTWQQTSRSPDTLWFELSDIDTAGSEDVVHAAGAAFAVAALPLAMLHRERALELDVPVCAQLVAGLESFSRSMVSWLPGHSAVSVEAPRTEALGPWPTAGRALGLSGGVDSLALLRDDRLRNIAGSPAAFAHGLYVFGLNTYDFAGSDPVRARVDAFRRYRDRLASLGAGTQLEVIGVATNVRSLYPDYPAWAAFGWMAGTAAPAHLFPHRIREFSLASSIRTAPTMPSTAQLLYLDALSSAATRCVLGLDGASRLEKVKLVAAWPPALQVLRTCLRIDLPDNDGDNCGACEKCVRTMVALVALGRLAVATTYPYRDVQPAMLDALNSNSPEMADTYEEMIEPLRRARRDDLARALQEIIHRGESAPGRGARGGLAARISALLHRVAAQGRR